MNHKVNIEGIQKIVDNISDSESILGVELAAAYDIDNNKNKSIILITKDNKRIFMLYKNNNILDSTLDLNTAIDAYNKIEWKEEN